MSNSTKISQTFNLITTTTNHLSEIRLKETIYSINKNLENDLIGKYYILLENYDFDFEHYKQNKGENIINCVKNAIRKEFFDLLQNDKIEVHLIKNKPTFRDVFDFCNNYNDTIWIFTNSNIHFPNWNNNKLKKLLCKNYDDLIFVLTRYNIYNELSDKIKTSQNGIYLEHDNVKYRTQHSNGSSIDSWIFKSKFDYSNINVDLEIGTPECDGRMSFQLSKIRKVSNPCLDVISIHKHSGWSPDSYNKINIKGQIFTRQEYTTYMLNKGFDKINIPFSKLKNKIVHLINPFKCDKENKSYLYYAQPITFKSMYLAKQQAERNGCDIQLYSVNYPEDDDIIPDYFQKLLHLKKSTISEFKDISNNRKLPIIQEMFDSVLNNVEFDYLIFTNSDIGVQKNFYEKVDEIIENGKLNAFCINRRDNIPKFKNNKRLTENDLDIIYKEIGEEHMGVDCFVISKNVLKQLNMGKMFLGYPPWGLTLCDLIKRKSQNFNIFEKEFLTFHLGSDKSWKTVSKHPLYLKNIELSENLKNNIK